MLLFGALQTQWQVVAGPGGLLYIGIPYTAVTEVERRLALSLTPETWPAFQALERLGRNLLNER